MMFCKATGGRWNSKRSRRHPERVASQILSVLLLLLAISATVAVEAYETDQYSGRWLPIADSGELLDQRVQEALETVAAKWRGAPDEMRFARKVYWKLGGLHWVDHIERWAIRNPQVEKLVQDRYIYRGASPGSARVLYLFGIGETFKLHDVLVGSDKLGHFFSQGYKYFRNHWRREWSLERVLRRGRFNERFGFGQVFTGVFSNGDLVANYEGFVFFRSLFEDGVIPGKPALVVWVEGRPRIVRRFTWADHVNDFWDEALLPSHYGKGLQLFLDRKLPTFCDEYAKNPELFIPRNEEALRQRYAHLGLRENLNNRMDRVCAR